MLIALALTFAPAARADGVVQVAAEAAEFRVGALRVATLRDTRFDFANDGKTFGLGIDPTHVAETLRAAGAADALHLEVNALLVRSGDRVIVIDTGLGRRFDGSLVRSLALAGVSALQVTDVLVTHAHGDHFGGLASADGTLTFPNATVRMSSAEWDWARAHPDAYHPDSKAIVAAIAPQVRTFTAGDELAPGVRAVDLSGHTPGHSGFELSSNGERLLAIGDTAHHSVISLAHPEWRVAFDEDAAAAGARRRNTLADLATSGVPVWSAHYPFPGVGRVVKQRGGYAWRAGVPGGPAPALSETERNRRTITEFAALMYGRKDVRRAFETFVADAYVQHNPGLPDGRAAALEPLATMFANAGFRPDVQRIVVDGDMAVLHIRVESPSAKNGAAVVDMYRLKDGKVVEHWDVIQLVPEKSANPHPMF